VEKSRMLCRIAQKRWIGAMLFDIKLENKQIGQAAMPGQFLHIKCGEKSLLRRPLSICDADAEAGLVRIVFEIRGEGTKWLADRKTGNISTCWARSAMGFP
jgi:dihydroorotate dehydrogenase electron transfer subunit